MHLIPRHADRRHGAALAPALCGALAFADLSSATDKPNILVIRGEDIGQFNVSAFSRGMMGYRTLNTLRRPLGGWASEVEGASGPPITPASNRGDPSLNDVDLCNSWKGSPGTRSPGCVTAVQPTSLATDPTRNKVSPGDTPYATSFSRNAPRVG